MQCPKCQNVLTRITSSLGKEYSAGKNKGEKIRIKVDQCFECNGVWFDAKELESYLKENLIVINSAEVCPELKQEHDEKIGHCPICDIELSKEQAPKDKNITIDKCQKCQGIWLDMTEIDILEEQNEESINKLLKLFSNIF